MVIIYGLGNNEEKYYETKHNVGRKVLEKWVSLLDLTFSESKSVNAATFENHIQKVVFLSSRGYMNESGKNLMQYISYYKLQNKITSLVIIQDDSDQIEGNWKFTQAGGSAGHHGINSVYAHLLSMGLELEQVWRLKIGIRPAQNKLRSETFVLNKLSQSDDLAISTVAHMCYELMHEFVDTKFDVIQNVLHSKNTDTIRK